jgi:hypothetical protein
MSLLGVHLNVLIGPGAVALPASSKLLEALREVEIKYTEEGRSGFKLTFEAGRTGATDFTEDPVVSDPQLKVKNRVVLTAMFGTVPRVVADGIITVILASPGDTGEPTLVEVAGEDLSILFDLEEKIVEHPAQPVPLVVMKIVGSYAQYGLVPMVIPPTSVSAPNPVEKVQVQRESDLAYINKIKPANYVFTVEPGPMPMVSTAYFGPLQRTAPPQKALSVNMGPETNCSNLSFEYQPNEAAQTEGKVQDSQTNSATTAKSSSSPYPALSQDVPTSSADVRKTLLSNTQGLTAAEAMAKAQEQSDRTGETLKVTGELDASAYGDVLLLGGIIGLRGAGLSYDGLYRIKEVSHLIKPGSYTQSFTLKREGTGSTVPVVPV